MDLTVHALKTMKDGQGQNHQASILQGEAQALAVRNLENTGALVPKPGHLARKIRNGWARVGGGWIRTEITAVHTR